MAKVTKIYAALDPDAVMKVSGARVGEMAIALREAFHRLAKIGDWERFTVLAETVQDLTKTANAIEPEE